MNTRRIIYCLCFAVVFAVDMAAPTTGNAYRIEDLILLVCALRGIAIESGWWQPRTWREVFHPWQKT